MKDIINLVEANLAYTKKTKGLDCFMQIGANCGDDEFTQLCKLYNPNKIVLVEPHSRYLKDLQKCYEGLPYTIENVAVVTDESVKTVTLYFPDCELKRGQHSTLVPMNDWNSGFPVPDIKATTFSALTNKHNITKIDLLMIDTEGYDVSIIDSIDFNKIDLRHIVFESWKFPTDKCYDKDHQHLFGTEGIEYIDKKLTSLGFTVIHDTEDYYAFRSYDDFFIH